MKGKKLFVALTSSALLLSGVAALSGCDKNKGGNGSETEETNNESIQLSRSSITVGVGSAYTLGATLKNAESEELTWASSDETVATVDAEGNVTGVGEGVCSISATTSLGHVASCATTVKTLNVASGAYDFSNETPEERTKILGALEKWAVDKKLTGITLYEDGGYVMYSPDVEKGASSYIKGYGFGTLPEGNIKADLAGEEEAKYKRYYHSYEDSDPAKILYMDDDGGVVSGLVGYVSGGYYDNIMNAEKNGYIWCADLATRDDAIPMQAGGVEGLDANGAASIYRIPVKTGSALKYSTLSTNPTFAAFNNREATIEDYVTPYKVYYTKAYGMRRNSEAKDDVAGSLVGTDAYIKASEGGFNQEAWDNLGIKTGHSETYGDYLEFTLNKPITPFYARYYLGGSLFAPVPADFIKALGGGSDEAAFTAGTKLWGKFNNTATLSPVDTFLSTGPYVLEEWVKDSKITYKRNPNYVSQTGNWETEVATKRPSSYHIQGVYIDIITALKEDNEAALKKFLNNELHAVTVPSTRIEEFANDPRTTIVPGSSTTKLNLNTCTEQQWEELFGENGSITQTAKEDYWDVKPCMSNASFVDGLNFCIDRKTFAAKLGATPSNDYFGSAYQSDAEKGVFYNDTQEHKDAVAENLAGTDGFGYSLEKAKVAFKMASDELIASGAYHKGDEITLEMAWMVASQEDRYAKPLAKMIEDAFNGCGGGLTLKITHFYGAVYTDVYYNKMMPGQFDIGYGGIEGNTLNPLNFMEVLKSDNSSTFTLNWGINTNEFPEIEYNGEHFTYDALWEVADHGGYVENGFNTPLFSILGVGEPTLDDEGNLVLTLKVKETFMLEDGAPSVVGMGYAIALFATTDGENYSDYMEIWFYSDGTSDLSEVFGDDYWCLWEYDEEDPSLLTITIAKACIDFWQENFFPDEDALAIQGFDMYYLSMLLGKTSLVFGGTFWEGYLPAAE